MIVRSSERPKRAGCYATEGLEKAFAGRLHMLIRRETLLGKLVDFAVVLVFEEQCITRYGSRHGCVHRDMLGKERA